MYRYIDRSQSLEALGVLVFLVVCSLGISPFDGEGDVVALVLVQPLGRQ